MSTTGYNERDFFIRLEGKKIASLTGKTIDFSKEGVDVTNDDSNAWRRFLGPAGSREVDLSVEGVTTTNNFEDIIEKFEDEILFGTELVFPTGEVLGAEDGFYFSNLDFSAQKKGYVAFSAQLKSSGALVDFSSSSIIGQNVFNVFATTGALSQGVLWTPDMLSSLTVWFKADAEVYSDAGTTLANNNDTVQQWNDQSSNLYHVSETTNKPLYLTNQLNSLPIIRFDGSNDTLKRSTNLGINTPETNQGYFAVHKIASNTPTDHPLINMDNFSDQSKKILVGLAQSASNDLPRYFMRSTSGVSFTHLGTSNVAAGSFKIRGTVSRNTGGSVFQMVHRLDGTQDSTTSPLNFSLTFSPTRFGFGENQGAFYGGDVAEIVICTDNVTDPIAEKIEGYLAWKWGLVGNLPGGHTYKNNPPLA